MIENEYRVIGPPGTGKTTYLSRQVERAVDAGRRVLVTSLTKAAAQEIGGRLETGWGFSQEQVGTLHSHCFRALGRPNMVGKKEHLEDWNSTIAAKNPGWRLSLSVFGGKSDSDRSPMDRGDELYESVQVLRARMRPQEMWPATLASFWKAFAGWKSLNGLLDFGDLIEHCVVDRVPAPFAPEVIFVDEAQDHDRLELQLVRQWSKAAEKVIICGDPDQNLYEWRGAEPAEFYASEIPPQNTRVLAQSYRVPRAVWEKAQEIIGLAPDRVPVEYRPTDQEGACFAYDATIRESHRLCEEAGEIADTGRSVMILTSCEYMLAGVLRYLRMAGIPFGNYYAKHRGNLNPLGVGRGIGCAQRLAAFLVAFGEGARRWTWRELEWWTDSLSVDGLFVRGARKQIEAAASTTPDEQVGGDLFRSLLAPGGAEELRLANDGPVEWYRRRLNASRLASFQFPLLVANRSGAEALVKPPGVCVGTIHSVKGGEADVVFLFPDLSPQGFATLEDNPASLARQFYVGATRAKEELRLCRGEGMRL